MPYNVLALKYHIIYHITSLVQTFPHINHPLFSLNTSDRRNDQHNVHKHINSSKLSKVTHQEEDIKYCHNQRRQTYHKITKILTPSHLKTLKQLLFTPLENHCSNLWHGVCFIQQVLYYVQVNIDHYIFQFLFQWYLFKGMIIVIT